MVATAGDNKEGGHLLFEVEHSVEPKRLGRPVHVYKGAKEGNKADFYKVCADATVASLGELLEEVGFSRFSILVNRRVLRPKDWQVSGVAFPASQVPQLAATSPLASPRDASPDAAQARTFPVSPGGLITPSPPSCPRARRSAAARYPRPGAFEVSAYDTERAVHRVLYSKYQAHVLPKHSNEIWEPLLPFLLIFAGLCNDEELMNRVCAFAREKGLLINLQADELASLRGQSLLLDFVSHGMDVLNTSITSGDPEQLHGAVHGMPHALRTAGVVQAEEIIEHLGGVQDKVTDALEKIESGFVTSGLECLQRALEVAEREGLRGRVMQDGLDYLHAAQLEGEEHKDTESRQAYSSNASHHASDGRISPGGVSSSCSNDQRRDADRSKRSSGSRNSRPPSGRPHSGRPPSGGSLGSSDGPEVQGAADGTGSLTKARTEPGLGDSHGRDSPSSQFRGRMQRRASEVVHEFLSKDLVKNLDAPLDADSEGSGARRRSRSHGDNDTPPFGNGGASTVTPDLPRKMSGSRRGSFSAMAHAVGAMAVQKKVRQTPDLPHTDDVVGGRSSPAFSATKTSSRGSVRMPGMLGRRVSEKCEMRQVEAELDAERHHMEDLQGRLRDAAQEFAELIGTQAEPTDLSDVSGDNLQGFVDQVKKAIIEQRAQVDSYSSEVKACNDECSQLRQVAEEKALEAKAQLEEEIAACLRVQEDVAAAEARISLAELAESAAAEREASIAMQAKEARFVRDDAVRRAHASQGVVQRARFNEAEAYAALQRERFECEALLCDAALQEAAAHEAEQEQLRSSEAAVYAAIVREGAMINTASKQVAASRAAALEAAAQEAKIAKATAEQVAACKASEAAAHEDAVRARRLRDLATDQAVNSQLAVERATAKEAATAVLLDEALSTHKVAMEKASLREELAREEFQQLFLAAQDAAVHKPLAEQTELGEAMKQAIAAKEANLVALESRSAEEATALRQTIAKLEKQAEQANTAAADATVELQTVKSRAREDRAAMDALLAAAEQEASDARTAADGARAEAAELKKTEEAQASAAAAALSLAASVNLMNAPAGPAAANPGAPANLPGVSDLVENRETATILMPPAPPDYYTRQVQADVGVGTAEAGSSTLAKSQTASHAPLPRDTTDRVEQQVMPPSPKRSNEDSHHEVAADSVASWSWDGGSAAPEEGREIQEIQRTPAISDELSAIMDIVLSPHPSARPSNPVAKVLADAEVDVETSHTEDTKVQAAPENDHPQDGSSLQAAASSGEPQDEKQNDVSPNEQRSPELEQDAQQHAEESEPQMQELPSQSAGGELQVPQAPDTQGSLSLSAESQLGDTAPRDEDTLLEGGAADTEVLEARAARQLWETSAESAGSPAYGAAPGEAPDFSDLGEAGEGLPNEELMCASPTNASRGEAPMGAEEAEAAPGEAPPEAELIEQRQLLEDAQLLSPSPDPLGDCSTGEAPVDAEVVAERLEPSLAAAQAESIMLAELLAEPQDFDAMSAEDWMLIGASTGEAPHTQVAETGEAPNSLAQSDDDAWQPRASHSTGEAPRAWAASHSTGEAPQTETPDLQPRPPAEDAEVRASHSTGEAPHFHAPQIQMGSVLQNDVHMQSGRASPGEGPASQTASHSTGEAPQTEVSQDQAARSPIGAATGEGPANGIAAHSTGEAPQTENDENEVPELQMVRRHSHTDVTASHSTGEAPQTEMQEMHEGPSSQDTAMSQAQSHAAQRIGAGQGSGSNQVTASHSTGEAPQTEIQGPQQGPSLGDDTAQIDAHATQSADAAPGEGPTRMTASHSTGEAPQTDIQEPQQSSSQVGGTLQMEIHSAQSAGGSPGEGPNQVAASHSTGESPQTDSWRELPAHLSQGAAAEGDVSLDVSASHSTGEAPQIDTAEWAVASPAHSVGTTPQADSMGAHSTGEAPQIDAPQHSTPELPTAEAPTAIQVENVNTSHSTGEAPQSDAPEQTTPELLTGDVHPTTQAASHSTGEAPQIDGTPQSTPELPATDAFTASQADGIGASHSGTGGAPHMDGTPKSTPELPIDAFTTAQAGSNEASHSTGEAPQTDATLEEATFDSPQADAVTNPPMDNTQASHSTGEAPQSDAFQHSEPEMPPSDANASHSTGEAPQTSASHALDEELERSLPEMQLMQTLPDAEASHSAGEASLQDGGTTGEAPVWTAPHVDAADRRQAPTSGGDATEAAQPADAPAPEQSGGCSATEGSQPSSGKVTQRQTSKLCLYNIAGKLHLHYRWATSAQEARTYAAASASSSQVPEPPCEVTPAATTVVATTMVESPNPETCLPPEIDAGTESLQPPETPVERSTEAAPEAATPPPTTPLSPAAPESAPEEQDMAPEAAPESAPETSPENRSELLGVEEATQGVMAQVEPEASPEAVTAVPEAAPEAARESALEEIVPATTAPEAVREVASEATAAPEAVGEVSSEATAAPEAVREVASEDMRPPVTLAPEASPEAATEDSAVAPDMPSPVASMAPEAAPEPAAEEQTPAADITPEAIRSTSPEAAPEADHEAVSPETADEDRAAEAQPVPEASPEASPEAAPEASHPATPAGLQDAALVEEEQQMVQHRPEEHSEDSPTGYPAEPTPVACQPGTPSFSSSSPKHSVCLGYEEAARMIDCALVAVRSGDVFPSDSDNSSQISDASTSSRTSREKEFAHLRASDSAEIVGQALRSLHARWTPADTQQDAENEHVFAMWEQGIADYQCGESTVDFEMENDAEHIIILNDLPSEVREQALVEPAPLPLAHVAQAGTSVAQQESSAEDVARAQNDKLLQTYPTEPQETVETSLEVAIDQAPAATDQAPAATDQAADQFTGQVTTGQVTDQNATCQAPAEPPLECNVEQTASPSCSEEEPAAAGDVGEVPRTQPGERLSIVAPSDTSATEQLLQEARAASSGESENLPPRGKPRSRIAPQRIATWCVGMNFPLTAEFLRELSQRQEQLRRPASAMTMTSSSAAPAQAPENAADAAPVGISPSAAGAGEPEATMSSADGAAARTILVCEQSGELQLTYDSSPTATTVPSEVSPGQSQAPTAAPDDGSMVVVPDATESVNSAASNVAEMAELRLQGVLLRERCRALERELRGARNGTSGAASSARGARRRK